MRKHLLILLVLLLPFHLSLAQRAKIKVEGVSPNKLTTLGLTTNSVSTGLRIVPNNTFVYLSAWNIADTNRILTATFTLDSVPAGSTASITPILTNWANFKPNVKGSYKVKLVITTATGTDDTTLYIVAGNYVGVGNYEGVSATFPQCMSCHGTMPAFTAIFDKWKVSGHATRFKKGINGDPSYYGANCFKCHTTGYNMNIAAANNGFDDVAATLGYVWTAPPNPGKWDSLKTGYAALTQFGTIGCEQCHGPGSEHGTTGNKALIQISPEPGVCGQCHDAPYKHNVTAMFNNSPHSTPIWSNSFAQGATSQNNSLGNCIRCHDGKGFINFTKGRTTNTTGMLGTDQTDIGCAACHDPHGNGLPSSLRPTPANSDTLGNGFRYTAFGGKGQTCMNCHKARRDNVTYVRPSAVTATWGPHHSVQTDVLLGQNAADFGQSPYQSSSHKYAVANACVDCHMYATPDTGNVNRDKVGGHTFHMVNPANGFEYTKSCESCHGPKGSFAEFVAAMDYDRDGTVESIQGEVSGLVRLLRIALPPAGVDSVSWQLINTANDSTIRKAFWNYQLIMNDGSYGMHNAKFAISVLTRSITMIGGVIPVELTSFAGNISGNVVTLNWETATETNNKGFSVERNISGNWVTVGFVNGRGTTTEVNKYNYTDKLTLTGEATVSYRLKQVDYNGASTFSKAINVNFVPGPKEFVLGQNYPNPFNPTTNIKFTVPAAGKVRIAVYNAMGKLVKELVNETYEQGTHSAVWDGKDAAGKSVASGIYFYKLEAGTYTATKKMVMMK